MGDGYRFKKTKALKKQNVNRKCRIWTYTLFFLVPCTFGLIEALYSCSDGYTLSSHFVGGLGKVHDYMRSWKRTVCHDNVRTLPLKKLHPCVGLTIRDENYSKQHSVSISLPFRIKIVIRRLLFAIEWQPKAIEKVYQLSPIYRKSCCETQIFLQRLWHHVPLIAVW